ncbi:DUF1801 domain-containing protein [Bremerella sp. T1]|uniref:DUF1801 domain-containing protein n=1 Tax=Bremerella sp. TYQ1 TaxID=3119568 RepID=UPI001CCEA9B4|nr:DUF1801 domain-containing protein [Bremerella volcania]UBM33968.1 DUF1801 domain-containing protein [Bremerella volcania]
MGKRRPVGVFSPKDLLADFPLSVRDSAETLRKLLKETVPGVREKAYPGWRIIGYRDAFYFAFIQPKADHVRLGFQWGTRLPDEDGLLQGEDLSHIRYVPFDSPLDIPTESLTRLIQYASQHK